MKLLTKQEITSKKNEERMNEVREGAKLAKTVDALRDTKSKEEANLAKFRLENLKIVQSQIDEKIKERDGLDKEIALRKEERLKLEAPIDLTNEWKQVNELKSELSSRETHLITREALVQNLEKREKIIVQKEAQASHFLDEARKSYTKTDDLRNEMESRKAESDKVIDEKLKEINAKEVDLMTREEVLKEQKAQLAKDQKELLDKGTSLIGRESKLEAGIKQFFEREEQIKEKEALTQRYNDEASKNYDVSDRIRSETQAIRDEAEKDIQKRYLELTDKERDFGYKERDLILQKEGLEIERKEIEKEKLHIASQQKTLREAWVNVKKLQEQNK